VCGNQEEKKIEWCRGEFASVEAVSGRVKKSRSGCAEHCLGFDSSRCYYYCYYCRFDNRQSVYSFARKGEMRKRWRWFCSRGLQFCYCYECCQYQRFPTTPYRRCCPRGQTRCFGSNQAGILMSRGTGSGVSHTVPCNSTCYELGSLYCEYLEHARKIQTKQFYSCHEVT
jgi:hypothetical protein